MLEDDLFIYDEFEEYIGDYIKDGLNKFFDNNFVFPTRILFDKSSCWSDTYNSVVKDLPRLDFRKKKVQLPEIYFGKTNDASKYLEELKNRYCFLYENSLFLLAPLVYKYSDNDIKVSFDKKFNNSGSIIFLANDLYLSALMEMFLFSSTKVEDSEFYKKVLEFKEDETYLNSVKSGLELIKEGNLKEGIDDRDKAMFNLLSRVHDFISSQPESINRSRKLCILDEYFRILRYDNTGTIRNDGYASRDKFFRVDYTSKKILGRGVGFSEFINAFSVRKSFVKNSYSTDLRLSEDEKQEIYLKFHDCLPWNLDIECKLEDPNLKCLNDERLIRPENTKPCGVRFRISEGEIFVHGKCFYHLCNSCGYIVKVDDSLLSNGVKQRIIDNCSRDKDLFRKKELLSELHALDDRSSPKYKVLFK